MPRAPPLSAPPRRLPSFPRRFRALWGWGPLVQPLFPPQRRFRLQEKSPGEAPGAGGEGEEGRGFASRLTCLSLRSCVQLWLRFG